MKVLLVYPNTYLDINVPVGVSTLSAVLKRAGHEVSVFDFTFIKTNITDGLPKPTPVGFLATAYTIDDLVKNDPVESIEDKFLKHLKSFQPDLIGLSATTHRFDMGIQLLDKFRSQLKCPVVVGGVHPTTAPEDALRPEVVDMICIGEGEDFIIELCDCLTRRKDYKGIRNLGYKTLGGIRLNALRPLIDMDSLPTPDWSAFDERHLFRPFMGQVYKGGFYSMSRGCPYNCSYCYNKAQRRQFKGCGTYYRFEKASTTIAHLTEMKKKYGATWYKFGDDSLLSLPETHLEELAEGFKCLGINFGCHIRPETVTESKVTMFKKMGCVAMTAGIESGNPSLRQKVLNRKMSDKQIESAMSILKKHNIRITTFNLIGIPGETREDVFATIRLNRKIGAGASTVHPLYPYPGTDIAIQYKTSFRDNNGEIVPFSKGAIFGLSQMPPTEVEGLVKTFNLYLLLPEELWPIIGLSEESDKTNDIIYNALLKYSNVLINKRR